MSTIFTHPVVPLAIGVGMRVGLGSRVVSAKLIAVGCLFSILPDVDVIGFNFGVSYYSPFGHRGFTHSIIFALVCALFAAQVHTWFKVPRISTFLFLSLAMISHAVLDALTYGGLGVGAAWPFNHERYFFPWRPLPVSPVSAKYFFNSWGMLIFKAEVIRVWVPLLVCMLGLCSLRLFRKRS